MKHATPPHRLAGLPVIFAPQTRTPLAFRLRAALWRTFFSAVSRLELIATKRDLRQSRQRAAGVRS